MPLDVDNSPTSARFQHLYGDQIKMQNFTYMPDNEFLERRTSGKRKSFNNKRGI